MSNRSELAEPTFVATGRPGYRGHALVLCRSAECGDRLRRWIRSAGEDCAVFVGPDATLLDDVGEDAVCLVVTDLDPRDPASRRLLDRLAWGESLESAPRIHIVHAGEVTHDSQVPSGTNVLVLTAPVRPEEFQVRARLAAEIGRLRHRFIRDPKTRVYHRDYLMSRLEAEFSRARRHRTPLSFVLFDVDQLRKVNTRFGQAAGDTVIEGLCRALRANIRQEDVLGHMGDESFASILPGNGYRGAAHFANKVRSDAEHLPLRSGSDVLAIRASAGVSTYPDNPEIDTAQDLVRFAESALAEAKARGGNRIFIDEAALRHGRKLILLADHDPALLDTAEDLLATEEEYRVIRAESMDTMLETVRYRRPDLIVFDLALAPEEEVDRMMDEMRSLFPEARVPILALASSDQDPAFVRKTGVDRYLTKPFSVSLLRTAVRDLLEAAR